MDAYKYLKAQMERMHIGLSKQVQDFEAGAFASQASSDSNSQHDRYIEDEEECFGEAIPGARMVPSPVPPEHTSSNITSRSRDARSRFGDDDDIDDDEEEEVYDLATLALAHTRRGKDLRLQPARYVDDDDGLEGDVADTLERLQGKTARKPRPRREGVQVGKHGGTAFSLAAQ